MLTTIFPMKISSFRVTWYSIPHVQIQRMIGWSQGPAIVKVPASSWISPELKIRVAQIGIDGINSSQCLWSIGHDFPQHYFSWKSLFTKVPGIRHSSPAIRMRQIPSIHPSIHPSIRPFERCKVDICSDCDIVNHPRSGWIRLNLKLFFCHPSENMSQLGWLFLIYGKIKHVPNQQPVI